MIKTEKMDIILDKCRIIKEFAPLPSSILGYYFCDGEYYIILINEAIKHDERLYRTVLAEEIGHYRTTIGDITPRKYMCYADRITVDRHELKALKWATDFLIPTETLLNVLKTKTAETLEDLVNYFYVTNEFFMKKLEFMARQNPIWDIDEERYLCLYKLPSVYIFKKFDRGL